MLKKLVFVLLNLSLICSLNAQSAKKLLKQGGEAFTKGNYVQAADFFEKSWQKGKKPEAAFKAGEAYYLLRNYRKASDAYANVKDKNDQFPLVGIKYARSLKQDGNTTRPPKHSVIFGTITMAKAKLFWKTLYNPKFKVANWVSCFQLKPNKG